MHHLAKRATAVQNPWEGQEGLGETGPFRPRHGDLVLGLAVLETGTSSGLPCSQKSEYWLLWQRLVFFFFLCDNNHFQIWISSAEVLLAQLPVQRPKPAILKETPFT